MKKNVLITGASSGIGFAIAIKFAENGDNVFLVSKNNKRLSQAKKKIKNKYHDITCESFSCDFTNKDSSRKVFQALSKKFNKIDVLINNVGGGSKEEGDEFIKTEQNNFDLIYKKNIFSTFALTQLCLSSMLKNRWGRIITISSSVTQKLSGKPIYKMNKIAQVSLMKSLSTQKKYVGKDITFNCVSPGAIFTETSKWTMLKSKKPKLLKKIINRDFPKGIGLPADVANVVHFLASKESRYVNGTNIIVDGGNINVNKTVI